jgi:hypothetical protein
MVIFQNMKSNLLRTSSKKSNRLEYDHIIKIVNHGTTE